MTDGVVMTIGRGFPYGLQLVNHNLLGQLIMNNGYLYFTLLNLWHVW